MESRLVVLIACIFLSVDGSSKAGNSSLRGSLGATSPLNSTDAVRSLQGRIEGSEALKREVPSGLRDLRGMLEAKKADIVKEGIKDHHGVVNRMIEDSLGTVDELTEIIDACTESECNAGEITAHGLTLVGSIVSVSGALGPVGPILQTLGSILSMIFGSAAPQEERGITLNDIKGAIFSELVNFEMKGIIEVEFPIIEKGKLSTYIKFLSDAVELLQDDDEKHSESEKAAYLKQFLIDFSANVNPGLSDVVDEMNRGWERALGSRIDAKGVALGLRGRLLSKLTFQDKCDSKCPSGVGDWEKEGVRTGWDKACKPELDDSQHMLMQLKQVLHGYRNLALQVLSIQILVNRVYELAGWSELEGDDAYGAKSPRDIFNGHIQTAVDGFHFLERRHDGNLPGWYGSRSNLAYLDWFCKDIYTEKTCNCRGTPGKSKTSALLDGKCKCDFEEMIFVPPGCHSSFCDTQNDGAVIFHDEIQPGRDCQTIMDKAEKTFGDNWRIKVSGTCRHKQRAKCPLTLASHTRRFGIGKGGVAHRFCARRNGCASTVCQWTLARYLDTNWQK